MSPRIAIVGAGPHALTVAARLVRRRPELVGSMTVFDPRGCWLAAWEGQFARHEIPHLRSPSVHHPHPSPDAFGRFDGAVYARGVSRYRLPETESFSEFCRTIVKEFDLGDRVDDRYVAAVEPRDSGMEVHLSDGTAVAVDAVVVATNPTRPRIPVWAERLMQDPTTQTTDGMAIDLREYRPSRSEHVVVVGGGLTAGHLAMGAIARGAQVTLVARRPIRAQMFDADPGWMGPKYLDGFGCIEDWSRRADMIRDARDGGTMTPMMRTTLDESVRSGALELREGAEVSTTRSTGGRPALQLDDGSTLRPDRVWIATGTVPDIAACEPLAALTSSRPVQCIDGLPVVDGSLQWPGCPVFLTGALAALRIGPVARNLAGARMAAVRISAALLGAR